jgi:phosphoglycerate kinase
MLNDYNNKRVLLRLDLNLPISEGVVLDYTRLDKVIPTIKNLLEKKAIIIIATHFGRPKGKFQEKYSVKFLISLLSSRLNMNIKFCDDLSKIESLLDNVNPAQDIILLENLRFYPGEESNEDYFAKILASFADYYVNDAFSCCHRAHASIDKITKFLPSSPGLFLIEEVINLEKYVAKRNGPTMAIIGGSKISTKIGLLKKLTDKIQYLAIGGAMANNFFKVQGYDIGNSFYEPDFLSQVEEILNSSCNIILPKDVVIAKAIELNAENKVVDVQDSKEGELILDLGPSSVMQIIELLKNCKTVIMNGPLGVFEYFPFSVATVSVIREIAKLTAQGKIVSIAGGGDIVAALNQSGLSSQFSYVSTAGGAFLEWLEDAEVIKKIIYNLMNSDKKLNS